MPTRVTSCYWNNFYDIIKPLMVIFTTLVHFETKNSNKVKKILYITFTHIMISPFVLAASLIFLTLCVNSPK